MGQDDAVGSIGTTLLTVFCVLLVLQGAIFGYQLQTFNTFRQQVNYRIERNGGLTQEAISQLKEDSDTNYSGWYSVESDQLGDKVTFGDSVDYTLVAEYPVIFMGDRAKIKLGAPGRAISQVR